MGSSERENPNDVVTETLAPSPSDGSPSTAADGPRALAAKAARAHDKLATGTMVGRYILVERLGAGGMGVVYAAYDPELDRRVAIKLIHTDGDKQHRRQTHGRLLREAQALAQLSHPNVVAVHDVGEFAGDVFVAMELIRGSSLRQLLREQPPFAERRRIMIAAGRGLAAAHRAGLVHRDVKPANILVGEDGRTRVVDFGLARAASADGDHITTESSAPDIADTSSQSEIRLRTPLTEYGSLVGTPAYMAPELFAGRPASPLTDQFSFCVTAFEVFYGARPFAGSGLRALRDAIQHAEPVIPDGPRVPPRLRNLLLRGLSKDPASRFPSMDALLDELAAEPVVTPMRVAGAALFATALVGSSVAIIARDNTEPCAAAGEDLAGVWNEQRRGAIRAAFAASNVPYAATTAARVEATLGDYATAWTQMRVASCRATKVTGTQSEHLLDLRTACLDRRRLQLAALTDVFVGKLDEALVRKATSAAAGLPPLATCADASALTAAVPPPETPQLVTAVAALQAGLDRANALVQAGRYDQARELALPLTTEADRIDYEATRAEAHVVLGKARLHSGDFKGAEADFLQAIGSAARSRDDRLAAEVWALLIYTLGKQARHQDALLVRTAAEAAVDRAGNDPLLRSTLLANLGGVLNQLERFTDSEAVIREAIALRERASGTEQPELASMLSNMGNSLGEQGRHKEARAFYDRAIAVWERTVGPDHPQLGIPLNNLGNSLSDQGEYAEAERYYRRAIDVWERAMGPNFPNLAYPHNGLGATLNEQRRYDEAWVHFERAYALWKAQLGDDHPDVAIALNNLGDVLVSQRKFDKALDHYKQALAINERSLGANHPAVTFALTGMGECHLGLGRPADALPVLERAWKIRTAGSSTPMELTTTQFALARALHATGDHRRARTYATEARDRLGDKPSWQTWRAEIDAWLAKLPR